MKNITGIRHPEYSARDWILWRTTYEGGENFINRYLEKFSKREDATDFACRKKVTFNPAFAAIAVDEIRNAIYQRMPDIVRTGGTSTYIKAIGGDLFGVDLLGSSMNTFMGIQVLKELLVMKKVGIYVDMPSNVPETLSPNENIRPYLYTFCAEDICSWSLDDSNNPNEFKTILLKEQVTKYHDESGLPNGTTIQYRYMYLADGGVHCCFYNPLNELISEVFLAIPTIPIVIPEISQSLLKDTAKYQIALLNLQSSDISYILKSNFPFYTEQQDFRANSPHLQGEKEVQVGAGGGRAYATGTERPGFIHPSSEPLEISIRKQEQLKAEIRQLVHLAVSSLTPGKQASAESKSMDQRSLEEGLSYIGLELERAERRIGMYWSMYENSKLIPTVNYPRNYSLKSDDEALVEAKSLIDLLDRLPSLTAKKEMLKLAIRTLLAHKISVDKLITIETEIDNAAGISSDYLVIEKDILNGLVDKETASKLRGYKTGVVEKATQEHIDRLKEIQAAQTAGNPAARGIPDLSSNPKLDVKAEKNGDTISK